MRGKADKMANKSFRVVTQAGDGSLKVKDYTTQESIEKLHTQIGIDDCSTDLTLRGMPIFRGLVGPMPEGKNIVRYEAPDVFESLTKEWSAKPVGRTRRRSRSDTVSAQSAAAKV